MYKMLFRAMPVNSSGFMLTVKVAIAKHYTFRLYT